jgi:hypothetical protein
MNGHGQVILRRRYVYRLTGFLAMKVGKAAATAVGGGIIILQLANHKGYINVSVV